MEKTIKVYDIQITAGPDAGCYRMFGVADKARAEDLAAYFAKCGTAVIVIERDEEIIEFADQEDMMNWLMQEEPEAHHTTED